MRKGLILPLLLSWACCTAPARANDDGTDSNPYFEHEIQTQAALLGVDYSPDGKRIVTCGLGRDVVVYDVESGKPLLILKGHTDDVVAVKYSPNGRYIASGGVDKALILWDALTGELLRKNTDHTDYVRDVAFGHLLAAGIEHPLDQLRVTPVTIASACPKATMQAPKTLRSELTMRTQSRFR